MACTEYYRYKLILNDAFGDWEKDIYGAIKFYTYERVIDDGEMKDIENEENMNETIKRFSEVFERLK